jgi:hypothetical protein
MFKITKTFSQPIQSTDDNQMKDYIAATTTGVFTGTIGVWNLIHDATSLFALVSSFCGAMLGVYGVVKMFKHTKKHRNQ